MFCSVSDNDSDIDNCLYPKSESALSFDFQLAGCYEDSDAETSQALESTT